VIHVRGLPYPLREGSLADLLRPLGRGPVRVATHERREEQIFVPPHHALRQTRRAAAGLHLDGVALQLAEPERIHEGPIGLQLHSNKVPQEIHFKDLTLTTFPQDRLVTVKN